MMGVLQMIGACILLKAGKRPTVPLRFSSRRHTAVDNLVDTSRMGSALTIVQNEGFYRVTLKGLRRSMLFCFWGGRLSWMVSSSELRSWTRRLRQERTLGNLGAA